MTPALLLATAGSGLAGLSIATLGTLRGWNQWLALKRLETEAVDLPGTPRRDSGEIAELRKRVRKLEAIANGIEL
jgi:hypothetical protein